MVLILMTVPSRLLLPISDPLECWLLPSCRWLEVAPFEAAAFEVTVPVLMALRFVLGLLPELEDADWELLALT